MHRILFPAVLLLAISASAAETLVGATRSEAEADLGKPIATRRTDTGEVFCKYERGVVTYRENRVVGAEVMSREAFEKAKEAERAAAEAMREKLARLAKENAARLSTANAARDDLTASAAYKALTTEGKIARIAEFEKTWPAAQLDSIRADLASRLRDEAAESANREAEAGFRKTAEAKLAAFERNQSDLVRRLTLANEANETLSKRVKGLEVALADAMKRLATLEAGVPHPQDKAPPAPESRTVTPRRNDYSESPRL